MELEKTNLMNTLFECYGSLLTDKQQEYIHLYYAEDYSLGEIADDYNVSRQAVYDNIKRTEGLLKKYEEKLSIVSRYERRRRLLNEMHMHVERHYAQDTHLLSLIQAFEKEEESTRGL